MAIIKRQLWHIVAYQLHQPQWHLQLLAGRQGVAAAAKKIKRKYLSRKPAKYRERRGVISLALRSTVKTGASGIAKISEASQRQSASPQ